MRVSELNEAHNPVHEFVFKNADTTTARLVTPDPGRALITGVGKESGLFDNVNAFKIPTLWGVSKTAPYFHDNSARTLEDVVAHYKQVLRSHQRLRRTRAAAAADRAHAGRSGRHRRLPEAAELIGLMMTRCSYGRAIARGRTRACINVRDAFCGHPAFLWRNLYERALPRATERDATATSDHGRADRAHDFQVRSAAKRNQRAPGISISTPVV